MFAYVYGNVIIMSSHVNVRKYLDTWDNFSFSVYVFAYVYGNVFIMSSHVNVRKYLDAWDNFSFSVSVVFC